jgi:transposase
VCTGKSGSFTQDSVGDWFLCLPVAYPVVASVAPNEIVGLDLGLKATVATSDGEKLEAGQFYRQIGHKNQTGTASAPSAPSQALAPPTAAASKGRLT